ncbi:hypothetical protein GF357_05245 [Candidatus Dojkabacteria bacterium]|nr:hypothetical protein [Candidatus Dojkabacteria bacterium]
MKNKKNNLGLLLILITVAFLFAQILPKFRVQALVELPDPDFSTFINCVELNGDGTFTAYYGYVNRNEVDQPLDRSDFNPSSTEGEAPQTLKAGRHDKAFTATASIGTNIVWTTKAGRVGKTATASSSYTKCEPEEPPEPPAPDPDFSTFINCVEINDDDTFTAYYGYLNRNEVDQVLDRSDLHPFSDDVFGNPPQILEVGRYDKAFTATGPIGTNIVWTTKAGDLGKTATASSDYTKCEQPEPPGEGSEDGGDDNIPESSPEPSPEPQEPQEEIQPDNLENELLASAEIEITESEFEPEISFLDPEIESNCENQKIIISQDLTANVPVVAAEYSIDGGNSWYGAEVATEDNAIYTCQISTRSLPSKLYGYQLKIQTAGGEIFKDYIHDYSHACTSEGHILGVFYQNGFGSAVADNLDQYVYNPSLPSRVFVETVGGVDELELVLSKDSSNFETDTRVKPMHYDFNTDLWYVDLKPDDMKGDVLAALVRGTSEKRISSFVVPGSSREAFENEEMQERGYSYKVYHRENGIWDEYNYDEIYRSATLNLKNQSFNLVPGEYFIEVTYPDGKLASTEAFALENASVVEAITDPSGNPPGLLKRVFGKLDINIYGAVGENNSAASGDLSEIPDYEQFKSSVLQYTDESGNGSKFVAAYWNRWNPQHMEILSYLEEIGIENEYKVYFMTDINNYHELEAILKIEKSSAEAVLVDNPAFIQNEISDLPEVIIFRDGKIEKSSLLNLEASL